MQTNLPIYSRITEDRSITQLIKSGVIDKDCWLTPAFKQKCVDYKFKLGPQSIQSLLAVLKKPFVVGGRREVPLNIETNMRERALRIREVAKAKFGIDLRVLFLGGGIWKPCKAVMLDFCNDFGLNACLTPIFLEKLNVDALEYDFQCKNDLNDQEKCQILVDEGFVQPLADKINWTLIEPEKLLEKLADAKKYASDKLPKDAYLNRIFQQHPHFDADSKNLPVIAMKVFGFRIAADVIDEKSANRFFLRNIGNNEQSCDWFVPIKTEHTHTANNSLFIDITPLLENEKADIYIESFLGPEKVPQAIVDTGLGIIHADPSLPANELDFARSICLLTKKGRCWGKGWFAKTFEAFEVEREQRNLKLHEMLSPQLISRAKHHRSPHLALIVLTFNASAILLWLNPDLAQEVQKLWEEIFAKSINKSEESLLKKPAVELIEQIKILMRSNFSFLDLYAQIQISLAILHYGNAEDMQDSSCEPTQNEEELFTQFRIQFSQKIYDSHPYDGCTFLFPFKLVEAIKHMQKLAERKDYPINHLTPIHHILGAVGASTIGMGKSGLCEFRLDPRRQMDQCSEGALNLLHVKQKDFWMMGYLLIFSHLALDKDIFLFKKLIKSLVRMLRGNWADDKFKGEASRLLQEMLKNSEVDVRSTFFQSHTMYALIADLLSANEKGLNDVGWEYFKAIENNQTHDILETLYFELIKSYLQALSLGRNENAFLNVLLKHLVESNQLSIESSFKIFITLYNNIEKCFEAKLIILEALTQLFHKTESLNGIDKSQVLILLPNLVLKALKSESCSLIPNIGLSLAYKAHTLKVFGKASSDIKESFTVCVQSIHDRVKSNVQLCQVFSTHEYDALSDFMQNYGLHNVICLKSSIRRRLENSSTQVCLHVDKEEVLQLIKRLIDSDACWNERFFLVDELEKIGTSERCTEVMELFISRISSHPLQELLIYYIDQLKKNEQLLGPWMLGPLLDLLCGEDQTSFTDEQMIDCVDGCLRFNSQGCLSPSISDIILDRFVEQLYKRSLWQQILCLCSAQPNIIDSWTPQRAKTFILSLDSQLKDENKQLCSENLIIDARSQLLKLPQKIKLTQKANSALETLSEHFRMECMQSKQFIEALQWFERLQFCRCQKIEFELLTSLVDCGHQQEAEKLLLLLYKREGSPSYWVKVIKMLVDKGHLKSLYKLVKEMNLPGNSEIDYRPQWLAEMPEMRSLCQELSKSIDKDNKLEWEAMYQLTHHIFCLCKPESGQWIEYIKNAAFYAPVDILDKILGMLANENELPLENHQFKVICWHIVLEKLSHLGSSIFLQPSIWWPAVWKDYTSEPITMKTQLVYYLVNGAVKAALPDLNNEKLSNVQQDKLKNSVSGIEEILKILEIPEVFKLVSAYDISLAINFAMLCWFSEISKKKTFALSALLDVFLNLGVDPINEEKAVHLFNKFMQTMPHDMDLVNIKLILGVVSRVQISMYSMLGDHSSILNFLKGVYKRNKLTSNKSNQEISEFLKFAHIELLDHISGSIKSILKRPKDHQLATNEDKQLIRWGLDKICNDQTLYGWILAIKSLEKRNIKLYVDGAYFQNKYEQYRDFVKSKSYIGMSINRLAYQTFKAAEAAMTPGRRWLYLKDKGLNIPFQIQPGESQEIKKATNRVLKQKGDILVAVATVMTFALLFFVLRSSK